MTPAEDANKPVASSQLQTPKKTDIPRDLRFIFVQLLFSLTAADTARQFSELALKEGTWDTAPAYAHLFLAGMVIITSWVGWLISEASRDLTVEEIFNWPFVVLLVDVGLVFLYFLLVHGAEVPKSGKQVEPSASNETTTLAIIFIGYFVWDLLTKAVIAPPDCDLSFWQRCKSGRMQERGSISLYCMILAILAWFFLRSVGTLAGVLIVDASLLCLVFLFRAWKEKKKKKDKCYWIAIVLFPLSIVLGGVAYYVG
jgi:hypothetical protein